MSLHNKISSIFSANKDSASRHGEIMGAFAAALDEIYELLPQKRIEPRLCTTCKHHSELHPSGRMAPTDWCIAMVNPIDGSAVSCEDARHSNNCIPALENKGVSWGCSLNGDFWEPKQQ